MTPLTLLDVAFALLVSKTAAMYAIAAASVIAPLYVFLLHPIAQALTYYGHDLCTNVLARAAHREGRNGSAAPFAGMEQEEDEEDADDAPQRGAKIFSGTSARAHFASDVDELVVHGQAVRFTATGPSPLNESPRYSTAYAVTDPDLREAFAAGEVYARPALRVLSVEQRIRRLFQRHQREELYEQMNITGPALNDLFTRPAFQAWYDAHREELLGEVQVRQNGLRLRGASSLAVVLLALLALPAFSFSNSTVASWGVLCFRPLPQGAPVSQATLAQLLVSRVAYLRSQRTLEVVTASLPCLRTASAFVSSVVLEALVAVVNYVELVVLVTAAAALVTSTVMPRGRTLTALTGVCALAVVLAESAAGGAELHTGMGIGVVAGVVTVSVFKAVC